ncbi:MAG: hypothetical protein J5639_00220 [Bacteroidales bacterium]|nr:hypothetical protein [Bacteroidales bacterium]
MKKIWIIAVLGIMALASCESKIDLPGDVSEKPVSSAAVFTATTESAATKTTLDDNYNVLWQNGDLITIVDGASHAGVYETTSTTSQGDFTHSSGEVANTPSYTAYYPSTMYNGGTLTLPAEQTYVAENISGAPMMAVSSTTSLGFKNLGGIIKLSLTTNQAGQKVSSIALSANQAMSGPFTVSSDAAVVSSGTAGVTLNCGTEGVAIGTDAVRFNIAVPAGNYTGLSITVTTTTGASQTFTLKSDKTVVVGRSQITTINLPANNIHLEYDLSAGNVTVPAGEIAIVTGSSDAHTLTIGAGASVTLQNTTSRQIITEGDATLTLVGDNVIAPITTDRFNAIIPANNSTLTIGGEGSLNCSRWTSGTMNYCINNSTVNLVIEGGLLTLNSSYYRSPSAVVVNNYTQTGGNVTIDVSANNSDRDNYPEGLYAYNDVNISGGSITSTGSVAIFAKRNMTISGGTVNADGNSRHYYGASGLTALGTLTISGGTVTATGRGGAVTGPGIGSTGTCGDIVITGGDITAVGTVDYNGRGSAGIGTSSAGGTCGSITVTSGIVRLAASKGNASAQAPIGKGNASSSVGSITIDGVENPTAESVFPNLNLVVSNSGNTWTFTPNNN